MKASLAQLKSIRYGIETAVTFHKAIEAQIFGVTYVDSFQGDKLARKAYRHAISVFTQKEMAALSKSARSE